MKFHKKNFHIKNSVSEMLKVLRKLLWLYYLKHNEVSLSENKYLRIDQFNWLEQRLISGVGSNCFRYIRGFIFGNASELSKSKLGNDRGTAHLKVKSFISRTTPPKLRANSDCRVCYLVSKNFCNQIKHFLCDCHSSVGNDKG